MPTLATLGAASARGFGDFYTVTSIPNGGWMAKIGAYTRFMTIDAANNLYVGNTVGLILKVAPAGTLTWQTSVNQSGSSINVNGLQFLNSNLIGIAGNSGGGAPVTLKASITLLDTSGNIFSSRYVSNTGNFAFNSMVTSDNGSLYLGGIVLSGVTGLFKYYGNSIVTKKFYSNASTSLTFIGGGSNDTAYLGDLSNGIATSITKVDSNISVLWSFKNSTFNKVSQVVESNGFIYAVGASSIVKLNASTGAFVWANTLSSSQLTCLAIDSSNNIYVGGYNSSAKTGILFKVSSGGTLSWQRNFVMSPIDASLFTIVSAVTVNNTNNSVCVLISTPFNVSPISILFSVPQDGTLTGTYTAGGGTLVYAVNSGSFSSVSYTFTTTSPSFGSPSYIDSALSLSSTAASTSYDLISIP